MRHALLTGAALAALIAVPVYAKGAPETPAPAAPPSDPPVATASAPQPTDTPPDDDKNAIVVTGKLDAARASIQPSLGATTYTISDATIQALPGGDNQQLNQMLLQLPGVVQDGFGQFHVRDDHNNLQYRINGTILPEGVAVFGQTLSPRLVDRFDLHDRRAARAIWPAHRRDHRHHHQERVQQWRHALGLWRQPRHDRAERRIWRLLGEHQLFRDRRATSYSNLGIEAVDPGRSALHDKTDQLQGFAYRRSHPQRQQPGLVHRRLFGPEVPDPEPARPPARRYVVGAAARPISSATISTKASARRPRSASPASSTIPGRSRSRPRPSRAIPALDYFPDTLGELLFNGLAQRATKHDFTVGGQVEGVYQSERRAHAAGRGDRHPRPRHQPRPARRFSRSTPMATKPASRSASPTTVPRPR